MGSAGPNPIAISLLASLTESHSLRSCLGSKEPAVPLEKKARNVKFRANIQVSLRDWVVPAIEYTLIKKKITGINLNLFSGDSFNHADDMRWAWN